MPVIIKLLIMFDSFCSDNEMVVCVSETSFDGKYFCQFSVCHARLVLLYTVIQSIHSFLLAYLLEVMKLSTLLVM